MRTLRFDVTIVFSRSDIAGWGRDEDLVGVMDAVQQAVAAVPGAADIDICYIGKRPAAGPRVQVKPHDSENFGHGHNDGNGSLHQAIETAVDRAITTFAGQVSIQRTPSQRGAPRQAA